ncbi:MAG: methyltransferase domain-containing protein, partial [Planctomycetota bacterium]
MSGADAWSPERYASFREERTQPFRDLLAGCIAIPGKRAVDLGCGTGDLTLHLHEATLAGSTLGVDRSASMLADAPKAEGLSFKTMDLERARPDGAFDLVFSNACLQWLPDHEKLLARVASWLAPGGQLAVQVPANHESPSHTIAAELAAEEFDTRPRIPHVLRPEAYAVILDQLGLREVHVRLQVYLHHLPNREAVFDWVDGTLLNAYRATVPDFEAFRTRYRERLLATLPDRRPYPFA